MQRGWALLVKNSVHDEKFENVLTPCGNVCDQVASIVDGYLSYRCSSFRCGRAFIDSTQDTLRSQHAERE